MSVWSRSAALSGAFLPAKASRQIARHRIRCPAARRRCRAGACALSSLGSRDEIHEAEAARVGVDDAHAVIEGEDDMVMRARAAIGRGRSRHRIRRALRMRPLASMTVKRPDMPRCRSRHSPPSSSARMYFARRSRRIDAAAVDALGEVLAERESADRCGASSTSCDALAGDARSRGRASRFRLREVPAWAASSAVCG